MTRDDDTPMPIAVAVAVCFPHVLRHTCASWLLWEGRTIWDVAGIIGATASLVENVYGHHRKIDGVERKRA